MFITGSNCQHHCNEARKRQTSQKPVLFLERNFLFSVEKFLKIIIILKCYIRFLHHQCGNQYNSQNKSKYGAIQYAGIKSSQY